MKMRYKDPKKRPIPLSLWSMDMTAGMGKLNLVIARLTGRDSTS